MSTIRAHVNALVVEDKNRKSSIAIPLEGVASTRLKSHKSPIVSLLVLFIGCRMASGTEVIVVFTKYGQAVLAADSLQTRSNEPNAKVCKIYQGDRIFWSAAGLVEDTGSGFEVDDFLKHCDVHQTLDCLDSRLTPALQKEVPRIKRKDPRFYRKVVREGYILSIFAVVIKGTRVEVSNKDFKLVNGRVGASPAVSCNPTPMCIQTVRRKEVLQYVANHPELWDGDVTASIDKLMQIAQAADPDSVGPPYSILGIDSNGARWLRQNNCADVNPSSNKSGR